ncbi:MAG: GspH/FimT family pseudopilin [Neisseria sp.]|nr:GspH/FimT family pseudopilin [Neisseria sp.]
MKSKHKGFTLIELMVVIAIAAIMMAIAIPNFSEWIARRRVAAAAEQVANLMRVARAEAVRLNKPVYVCPAKIRKDGKHNLSGSCKASDAGSGFVAWADGNNDAKYVAANDTTVRTVILNTPSQDARVKYRMGMVAFGGGNMNQTKAQGVVFYPDGSAKSLDLSSSAVKTQLISGYVKFVFTDAKAQTRERREERASIMLLSGGQVSFCIRDQREACKYEDVN